MSEPRDKGISKQELNDFYTQGCNVTQASDVDPNTPCMVGSRSYYKLWDFDDSVIIQGNPNVLYTFDYFVPEHYVFGDGKIPSYPGKYACSDLYPGWVDQCCPGGQSGKDMQLTFDKNWTRNNILKFAEPVRSKYQIPLMINQVSTCTFNT